MAKKRAKPPVKKAAPRKPRTSKPDAINNLLEKIAAAPPRQGMPFLVTDLHVARAREKKRRRGGVAGRADIGMVNPFQRVPEPPPGVLPKGRSAAIIAMDSGFVPATNAWAGSVISGSWSEGLQFLGYPYLSELAQRPEYRVITETIATEMTRKWIKFQVVNSGKDKDGKPRDKKFAESKAERIRLLKDALDKFKVRDIIYQTIVLDGFFGRSHIFIDLNGDSDNFDSQELITNIGNGRDAASKAKIAKGSLKRFTTVEPVWAYPTNYNAINPLAADWYKPVQWYVMSSPIHSSRLMTIVGREVPDLLKPAYAFGGLSLSQIAKPYVDNWLNTRQSVADIIQAFSVFVLKTDMQTLLATDGDALFRRADLFNLIRDNRGLMMLNKDSEEFANVSAPLAGLEGLQSQTQEHMASVSRIPIVKLLGIQPAGLNASSQGEIQTFYDTIAAYQESLLRIPLTKIIDIVQLSEFGDIDQDITFKFEPLETMTEKEEGEINKMNAEADSIRIADGVLSPEEVRAAVAADPDSPYGDIDVDDTPDLLEEEEEGLGGVKPGGNGPPEDEDLDETANDNDVIAHDELSEEVKLMLERRVTTQPAYRTRLNDLIARTKDAGMANDVRNLEIKLAGYYKAVSKTAPTARAKKNALAKAAALQNG